MVLSKMSCWLFIFLFVKPYLQANWHFHSKEDNLTNQEYWIWHIVDHDHSIGTLQQITETIWGIHQNYSMAINHLSLNLKSDISENYSKLYLD